MKKTILTILVSLLLLSLFLVGYLFSQVYMGDKEAKYEAKSSNWVVTVNYKKERMNFIEIPSIKFIGRDRVTEVQVQINYINDNDKFNPSNVIKKIEAFVVGEEVALPTRSKIRNYKNVRSVTLRWISDTGSYEEGIVLKKTD